MHISKISGSLRSPIIISIYVCSVTTVRRFCRFQGRASIIYFLHLLPCNRTSDMYIFQYTPTSMKVSKYRWSLQGIFKIGNFQSSFLSNIMHNYSINFYFFFQRKGLSLLLSFKKEHLFFCFDQSFTIKELHRFIEHFVINVMELLKIQREGLWA